MKGYIDNYEDLREWIKQNKNVQWNLYAGFLDRFNQAHLLAKNEDTDLDADESFELLQRMIQINASNGGQFTIYLPVKGNHGFSTKFKVNPTVAGIGGFPATMGNPYLSGFVPENKVQEIIAKERENWELRQRIEDLEAARNSNVSAIGSLIEKVTNELDINNLLKMGMAIFGQKLGVDPGMLHAVKLAGHPEEMEETGYTYDDPRLLTFLDTTRSKFESDEEFYDFLSRVGGFFSQNPALAIGFFSKKESNGSTASN